MTVRSQPGDADTSTRILDVAERLVQTRGFNAFSYADIASELTITKPALHYHFAGKADLGEALIARYTSRFDVALERIEVAPASARHKLVAYVELYRDVLAEDRMCLCGMLAADYDTLSETMRDAVVAFFDHNERWLADVLDQGRRDHTLQINGGTRDIAQMIIGTLEGAMLVARTYHAPARFAISADCLLAELTSASVAD